MSGIVTLAHGSGGRLTHDLIKEIFLKHFSNDILLSGDDSARIDLKGGRIAFTTDSYVITPIFFKGGDIGKIAVCGTVNDLTAAGAKPLYLSCGFIIEEGLPIDELEAVVSSMGKTAKECSGQGIYKHLRYWGYTRRDRCFGRVRKAGGCRYCYRDNRRPRLFHSLGEGSA